MKRLVLIDGHGILHRAYHALPPLTNSKGKLINAVFGFTSMFLRMINDLKPTHIAVVFDRPEPTFREKIYKDYQAQRPTMDKELVNQIDIVKRVLKEMGISMFEKAGYEADDVIATLVKQASSKPKTQNSKLKTTTQNSKTQNLKLDNNFEIIIVTGDRDILQLVDDKVKVYMPVKGLSQSKLYGKEEVKEKFGITPSQIVDYKALVGDPSDNYKGVSGIGPKTADDLLTRYSTLEQVYSHLDELDSDKLRNSLKNNIESAKMAKELAQIVQDVPIDIDLSKCELRNLNRPNVHALFEKMEFRSLIPRLAKRITNHESRITNRKKKNKKESKEKNNNTKQMRLL